MSIDNRNNIFSLGAPQNDFSQELTLDPSEALSIQRSWNLASATYNQMEIVRRKLSQQVALIEEETRALAVHREQNEQLCKQVLEQSAESRIAHEQSKAEALDTIAKIDQQTADILQDHIKHVDQRIEAEQERIMREKLSIQDQAKEIERLRLTLASLY